MPFPDICPVPFKPKIINDPIYGFIHIHHPLVMEVISHPWYQRLRRIYQMAFAHLVYPGAVHSRLAHSLGAYHLMLQAIQELRLKGIAITPDEEVGAAIAILLHDIGHGPFSHALEGQLITHRHHEDMSLAMMQQLNRQMDGRLQMAINIFTNQYPKAFLHQLVSGQLDVDRMDYLIRDSFYTGVSEGVIGYDRILKMLTVHNGELMVEEKAIYSIEKFLVARRLMYWQVYLHKTVLAGEQMLVRIVRRAKEIGAGCTETLEYFLKESYLNETEESMLTHFANTDDFDVMMAMKQWQHHEDPVLKTLCKALLNRKLYKLSFQNEPVGAAILEEKQQKLLAKTSWDKKDACYLAFAGKVSNTTYHAHAEQIGIVFKDGSVKDISAVDHALIQHNLSMAVDKYYICWMNL